MISFDFFPPTTCLYLQTFRKTCDYALQSLIHGDMWAVAVESAIGKLLNAFIVTDHRDSVLLRGCAREVGYNHLQIIIYDFARPR